MEEGRSLRRAAFTLIELLVVVAVIAVLVAILLPAMSQARERARGLLCINQMRQLGLQVLEYTQNNGEWLPQAEESWGGYSGIPWYMNHLRETDPQGFNARLVQCPTVGARRRTWRNVDIGYNVWLGYGAYSPMWAKYQRVRLGQVIQPTATAMIGDISSARLSLLLTDQDTLATYRIFEYGSWPSYRHAGMCNYVFVDGHGDPMTMSEAEPLYFNEYLFIPPMGQPFWPF